jgi:hypothetical protein
MASESFTGCPMQLDSASVSGYHDGVGDTIDSDAYPFAISHAPPVY